MKETHLDEKRSSIEKACKGILKDFEGILKWKWDDRFEALLAEFTLQTQDKVTGILKKHLQNTWDNKTIKNAPDIVKTTSEYFGDLRKGQLLFTTEPENSDQILAVWWPWGDGQSVSVRITIAG
jgi:hypothetical protein